MVTELWNKLKHHAYNIRGLFGVGEAFATHPRYWYICSPLQIGLSELCELPPHLIKLDPTSSAKCKNPEINPAISIPTLGWSIGESFKEL